VTDTASARSPVDVDEIGISELRGRYAKGDWSCSDVVREYLTRVEQRREAGDHAGIAAVNPHAERHAEELDDYRSRTGKLIGPLHGVPIVVKDQFETVEVPTRFGSRVVGGYRAAADASAVTSLLGAGAVLLAKTTMPDFGLSLFSRSSASGYTANPYNRSRDSGGSSSGSAAAVAANLCTAAIGEDTSGSIRIPASFTSLVGLRPTPGLVSSAGASPLLKIQDAPGPLTRTVRDAALLLDVLTGRRHQPPSDRYLEATGPADLRGVRIGLLRLPMRTDTDADAQQVQALVAAAAIDLGRIGASSEQVSLPRMHRRLKGAAAAPSIQRELAGFLGQRAGLAELSLDLLADVGAAGADLIGLLRAPATSQQATYCLLTARIELRRALVAAMRRYRVDVLCYPTAGLPAPRIADLQTSRWTSTSFPTMTSLAGQAGVPALTVPAGFTESGLPVGIEFLAVPYAEAQLIRIGHAYEQATRHRRPPPPDQ
jgi:Asp-tRNA(Asn)/Glu-tRNA(Gln) amidotransferase A subunit family amidase